MLVKICGVKCPELAHFAAEAGADFIGLVFEPGSKRYVEPSLAKEIAQAGKEGGAKIVGVFPDQSVEEILAIYLHCGLDILQLYKLDVCRELPKEISRIFVVQEDISQEVIGATDFLLYDNPNPGSGCPLHWESLKPAREHKFFLAGGLTPENVTQAVSIVQPDGVDVSTGVENESGEKDKRLIRAFMEVVK